MGLITHGTLLLLSFIFSGSIGNFDSERRCPVAFTRIGNGCYFYGYFRLNWFRAMEFCHTFGESVSLSVLETREENRIIKEWLMNNGDHRTGVWIGGSDNGHTGKWAWFSTGQLIKNFDWAPLQPNGLEDEQHCIYIVGGFFGYQWADFNCDYEMTFLCESGVNARPTRRERKSLRSINETIDEFLKEFL